jgi:hypothetical protein
VGHRGQFVTGIASSLATQAAAVKAAMEDLRSAQTGA